GVHSGRDILIARRCKNMYVVDLNSILGEEIQRDDLDDKDIDDPVKLDGDKESAHEPSRTGENQGSLGPLPEDHPDKKPSTPQGQPDVKVHVQKLVCLLTFISQIKPKKIKEALKDVDWIDAMQEELHQFEKNK
ncbi:hypothetical protein HAX54_052395, partial [Datura stramonium]|nr:hypothetical protein [Datura stramonium]